MGFKPRFKAGTTKPTAPIASAENKSADEVPPKAAPPTGFKPRFKPGVTKPAAPAAEAAQTPEQQKSTHQESPTQIGTQNDDSEQTPAKPLGFKPRFKAGVTKPATSAEDPLQQVPTAKPDTPKDASEQTPAKPLGFKPRFKAGITNKKNEDNE